MGFGTEGQEGNILFKKPGMAAFLRALAGAKAVIANARFSLVSEALYLGKPYLAMPVKNHSSRRSMHTTGHAWLWAWLKELGKEQN